MDTGRREFISTLTLGAAGGAALLGADWSGVSAELPREYWDLSWVARLKGKYRALFDIPLIEDGFGVWRAVVWRQQYSQVFGVPEASLDTVINLRHDGIALALNQEYWTRYDVAGRSNLRDPATGQPFPRNPVLDRTGEYALPTQFAGFTLEALMEGGAIVLACALALRDCATFVSEHDGIPVEEADGLVKSMLAPGVILQPSGVFAAVLAQDHGCRFVRAS